MVTAVNAVSRIHRHKRISQRLFKISVMIIKRIFRIIEAGHIPPPGIFGFHGAESARRIGQSRRRIGEGQIAAGRYPPLRLITGKGIQIVFKIALSAVGHFYKRRNRHCIRAFVLVKRGNGTRHLCRQRALENGRHRHCRRTGRNAFPFHVRAGSDHQFALRLGRIVQIDQTVSVNGVHAGVPQIVGGFKHQTDHFLRRHVRISAHQEGNAAGNHRRRH